MHHDHDHTEGCGCGHDHKEECGCGCGHDHHHEHEHIEIMPVEGLSILQQNMLLALYERKFLPVAQFTMGSTKDESVYAVALAPVYLGSAEDTMEQVKALGAELQTLEDGGLITLDYDLPLGGYGYQEYDTSALFRYFEDTVKEGSIKPDALFDTATLEKGSMALTEAGEKMTADMIDKAK